MTTYTHLRAAGTSLLLATGETLPRVLHWGADLGEVSESAAAEIERASVLPTVSGTADLPFTLGVLPEQSAGWLATPGVTGHRAGTDFSTAFVQTAAHATEGATTRACRSRARSSSRRPTSPRASR
ncbi:hypothetical protein [Serinibacter arcticus]|uniref:hypothetical protein n=1 Tax=Serinibacter arcticus TaxID=1655435 RepID=UPI001F386F88|nr:hypothetical protein [Serinibacter arcticus]